MKTRLIATTAIAVALAAPAFAQSRDQRPADSKAPPAQTQQKNDTGSTTAPPAASQNNQTGTGQSAGSTNPPANNSTTTSQAPASGNNPSQAQTAPPASAQPSSQQSANPPPANSNQAQQAPAAGTAQQPNPAANRAQQQPANTGAADQQPSTAQSSQTNVNANVQINDQQRTRISQSITRLDVKPLTNVNFSISVGTVVPRDVRLATLPPDVVEIVPQYRGYSFVVVRDEIVIVEPSTYKIVATLPYSGSSTAAGPARERSKTSFSDRDREVIRKHTRSEVGPDRRPEGRTTGSTARTDIRVGQRLPESVEIEEFPETVYRDAPTLREYRYIHRENRTYMIEPRERMVIEEID